MKHNCLINKGFMGHVLLNLAVNKSEWMNLYNVFLYVNTFFFPEKKST